VFFEIWEESVESATSHFRYQFVKLLVVFLLLTHWVASAFMCLAFVKDFDSHWLPPSSIADAGLLQQYVLAFYRSMDMITGGPQDPTDLDEQLFLIVVMIVSVFFVAIIIGSMADIVAQLNERDEAYRKKMDEIHMFCDDRRLPPDLTSRIKKHVSNWWKRKGGLQDSDVLQYLTPSLKNEVNVLLNEDIIQKCPLFQDCPDGFVHNLVSRLKPQLYSPGDVIVKNGDVGHEMYFVGRGECQILQKGKVLGTLTSGDYFGEIALLEANSTRTATIVAKGFCDLFVLQNTDFNKVTRIYPEQLARMQYQAALRRSRSALVAALHKVPDFDHVPERDKLIKALVSRFKPLAAEWMSGDTIFDTLDIANTLYFIGQGLVEIRSRKRVPVSSETQSARDIALLHKSAAVFNSKEKQSITEKIYANIKGELIGVLGQSEFFGWIDTAAHTHGVSNLFEWVHTHSADMDFDQFSKEYKTAVLRNDRRDMHMIHRENLGQGNTSHSFNVHAIIGDECHVDGVGIKVVVLCITATDIDEILEEFEVCESHVIDFVHSFSTEASYNKRTYSEQKQGGMKEMHNNPFVMRLARMYEEGKRDNFALFSLADKRFIHDYIRKMSGLIVDGMSEQVENAEGAQGD
jgi:voltage-gated potassium channel